MSAPYEHLALADLAVGMVLSDDILDPQGQVLLPKGATLNGATIALLPSHGVEMVAVLRQGLPEPVQDDAAILARLDRIFRNTDISEADDAATGLLRMYITDYRLGKGTPS